MPVVLSAVPGQNPKDIKVLVKIWADESDDIAEEKIERWKAGEEVDGIDGRYQGGELEVIKIGFVKSPLSRANGVEDPNTASLD